MVGKAVWRGTSDLMLAVLMLMRAVFNDVVLGRRRAVDSGRMTRVSRMRRKFAGIVRTSLHIRRFIYSS